MVNIEILKMQIDSEFQISNFRIGFYKIAKLLVENGADANAKISDDGTTPLHLAVKFG